MATAFEINPIAQLGQANPFGLIPGPLGAITPTNAKFTGVGVPSTVGMPNPFGDLSAIFPNLGGHNNAASALVNSQLSGELSPQVLANLQSRDALNAVRSGMPGSNAVRGTLGSNNALLGNIRSSEALQQQGFNNLGQLLNYGKSQVVSPELQTQIGTTNAGVENQFKLWAANAQNQNDQFNANNANRFAEVNLGTSKYNAENTAMANKQEEFEMARKLYDEYVSKFSGGSGIAQPPVISSLAGPGGGTGIFRDNYSFDSSGAALNPNYGTFAASGTRTSPSGGYSSPFTPEPQSTYTPQNLTDMLGDPGVFSAFGTKKDFGNFGAGGASTVQNLANLLTSPNFNFGNLTGTMGGGFGGNVMDDDWLLGN